MENHHFATSIVKTGFGKRQKAPGVLDRRHLHVVSQRLLLSCMWKNSNYEVQKQDMTLECIKINKNKKEETNCASEYELEKGIWSHWVVARLHIPDLTRKKPLKSKIRKIIF